MPIVPPSNRTVPTRDRIGTPQQSTVNSLSTVGSGVAAAGGALADAALKGKARENETRAKELDVEFSGSLRALQFGKEGYYNKKGKDASDTELDYTAAIDQLRVNFLDKAENESQRDMLNNVMLKRIENAKGGMARHSQREYNAWIDSAAQGRINDSIQESIVNYNNKDYIKVLEAGAKNEIITRAERRGQDHELTQIELEQYKSDTHAGTVEHLMQLNVRDARTYFEANKDEIQGQAQTKLMRSLKVAEKGDLRTDRKHYASLHRMAAEEPDMFVEQDLNTYELSDSDFKSMTNLQRTITTNSNKADNKLRSINNAMGLAKASLQNAGIDTTPKPGSKHAERIDEFQGALIKEMEAFKEANDRTATEQETLNMIDALLIQGTDVGSGWIFEDKGFLFEEDKKVAVPVDDIPDDDIELIKSAYQTKHSRLPDDDEIREAYTRRLFIETKRGDQ